MLITAIICSLVCFLLGVLIGALVHHCVTVRCVHKKSYELSSRSHTPPTSATPVVYEEITKDSPPTSRGKDIELERECGLWTDSLES